MAQAAYIFQPVPIFNKCDEKIVEDIINSLDYTLIKKFEKNKESYKEMLMDYAKN